LDAESAGILRTPARSLIAAGRRRATMAAMTHPLFGRVAIGLTLLATVTQPTPENRPTIAPYFNLLDGPAFLVVCRNNTAAPLNSGLARWRQGIRLDGVVVPPPPGGQIGPGLTTDVAAGATWRGILALPQGSLRYSPPVKFGALVRWGRTDLALADGRHTIAVQCGDVWSDDLEFYWDREKRLTGHPLASRHAFGFSGGTAERWTLEMQGFSELRRAVYGPWRSGELPSSGSFGQRVDLHRPRGHQEERC
jgi:hypothetical protein